MSTIRLTGTGIDDLYRALDADRPDDLTSVVILIKDGVITVKLDNGPWSAPIDDAPLTRTPRAPRPPRAVSVTQTLGDVAAGARVVGYSASRD